MKTTLIILLLLLQATIACGQTHKKGKAPLLIKTTSDNIQSPNVFMPCKCVQDSLKLIVNVKVSFDNEISDKTKTLRPVNMRIMITYSGRARRNWITADHINTPYDQCIWDVCSPKILEWLKYQPYNDLYQKDAVIYGKELFLAFFLTLLPE